jgi:hypothetical protein
MADRKKEMARIREVLTSCFNGQICRFVFLQGDYGMGKTFMLNVIYDEATSTRGVLAVRDVLTEKPILMRSLLRKTPESDLTTIIIKNMSKERITECWKAAGSKGHSGRLASVMERLKQGDDKAWMHLTGQSLIKEDAQSLGVKKGKLAPEEMLDIFYDLLRIIRAADYHTLLILVDEFEAIMSSVGKSRTVAVFDTFRAIFDEVGRFKNEMAKIVFVFGISGQALDKIMDLEQDMIAKTGGGGIAPFRERVLASDSIELKPFGPEETLELVKTRLEEVRKGTPPNPLYPFRKDAIDYIHQLSGHKPRFVLQNCYILLEEASKRKEDEEITRKFAEKVFEGLGLAPLDKEDEART